MKRNLFTHFADDLKRLGSDGVGDAAFSLGREGKYDLAYIPFEHVNKAAKLVIVGITPGNTQLALAYQSAQTMLNAGTKEDEILVKVKKAGAFGGPAMKPNLLKMLRHFEVNKILGIDDVESLWGDDADLLHSTSVVPHAAFKGGKPFNGSFDEIMASPILRDCFLDCFVPSARELQKNALFVALGPCPQAALDWCVKEGALEPKQVLGSFCHPSTAGGSTTRYFLREVSREELDPLNPVLSRCDWLDLAYTRMLSATTSLLNGVPPVASTMPNKKIDATVKPKPKSKIIAKPIVAAVRAASTTKSPPAITIEIEDILTDIERYGYRKTNSNKKLSEFRAPNDQTIYAIHAVTKSDFISIMANPHLDSEVLRSIDGVESVDLEHRFHSNMPHFPKRKNNGKDEITYGWKVHIASHVDLVRFLNGFGMTKF